MEKSGLLQIGDVAELFHLSVGTLRHYEKRGLLKPEYIDPETGYRYYSIRQFESLNTIRYLRALDTPLDQIADFLQNRDLRHMQELLRQQRETVVQKRRELENIQRKIENRLRQLEDAIASELDVIRCVACPPRRITWIHGPLSLDSSLDLEVPIRRLEGSQKNGLVFPGKIGVGISREHLMARAFEAYDLVFMLLDGRTNSRGTSRNSPARPA